MTGPSAEKDAGCECPPCPGRGNDGHGLTHCAECCFGSGVEADIDCPTHGDKRMPDAEKDAGVLAEAGWVGPWRQAFDACVRWSRMHGHRHRLRWSVERGHWRITCVTSPGGGSTDDL